MSSQPAGPSVPKQSSLPHAKNSWLTSGAAPRVLIYSQIVCQFILLSGAGSISALRPIVRTGSFATSLLLLFVIPRSRMSGAHPAAKFGLAAVAIVGLSIFHPDTNTLLAASAHALLYLAIFSPLFWMHRLQFDSGDLRKLFLTIWLYYSLSSVVGVLQFAYPGHFQPSLSSVLAEQTSDYIEKQMVQTAGGDMVLRPMGLTDTPGGAALAGFYAVLIGLGFFLTSRKAGMKVLCVASMGAGMTCLYLCQIRVAFVEAMLGLVVLLAILVRRGRIAQIGVLLAVVIAILGSGFLLAHRLGGETIFARLATLTEDSPQEIYYQNRGVFLEYTVKELLPNMPLGGGLGRYGMMNTYFGNSLDSIYVEIQWTGWLIDGGIPLIIAYVLAILAAVWFAWKTATSLDERFWVWGAVLLAYDSAACASTFNNPFFMAQSGLEFWLLNAALFVASHRVIVARAARPISLSQGFPRPVWRIGRR